MFAVKCLYVVWLLFACVARANSHIRTWHTPHPDAKTPSELMVDVINNLGLNILKMHNINNENNIALSPYGVASILTALLEGVRGRAALEIQQCGGFPSDKDVIRVGLRDIHRLLRSYFIPQEGFLSGLSLSSEKVTLKPDYQSILRFYGFDMTSFNTPIYPDISTTTPIPNITTTNEPPSPTTPEQTTTEPTTEVQTETTQTEEQTTPTITTPTSTTPIDTTTVTEPTTPSLTTEETAETRVVTQTMLPDTTPIAETTQTTVEVTETTTEITTPVPVTTEATTVVLTTESISTTEAGTTKTVEASTITESATTEVTTTPIPEDITTISPVKRSVQIDDGTTTIGLQTTTVLVDEFETTTINLIKRSILDVDINLDTVPINSIPIIDSLTTKYFETTTYNPPDYYLDDQTSPIDSFTNHLTKMEDYTTNNDSPISSTSDLTTSNNQNKPILTVESSNTFAVLADATLAPLEEQYETKPPNRAFITNLEDNITEMAGDLLAENLDAKILNQIERSVNKNGNSTKMADATKSIDNSTGDTINLVNTSKMLTNSTNNPTKIEDTTKNISATTKLANSATNKIGDTINIVDTSKTLTNDTKNMRAAALADELESGPQNRTKRSVIDYVIARYYDGRNSDTFVPEESDEKLSFLVSGIFNEKNVHFMTYDVVLPFFYISNLNALALKFPLDSPKYYLLLILPVDEQGIDSLICEIGKTASLKQIVSHMRPTYVRAVIPSFILRGFVILTSSLQKIGIRAIFEPNHSDFSPMTGDQNIYVTNIEQAITVMIKNYMDPNMLTKNRNLYQYSPVDFKATHPFLYFVMDSEIDVALVAGKIVNPINSRIQ